MLEHEYYLAMHPFFSLNITKKKKKRFEMIKHLILCCDCKTLVDHIVNNIEYY